MKSRYSFMTESSITDIDGANYPDPLTLNFNTFRATGYVESITLSVNDITHFWSLASRKYGTAILDDIVLTLNGVPHKNFLSGGDVVYFPSIEDIESSFAQSEV